MITREKVINFVLVIADIISFLLGAISMSLDIQELFPFIVGGNTIPIISFVIFGIIVTFHIIYLSSILFSKTPRIFFENLLFTEDVFPFMKNSDFVGEATSGISIGGHVLRIDVINDPKYPTEENRAKSVKAIIDYYDNKGNIIVSKSKGRWASGNYPKSSKSISDVSSIEIISNGSPEKLDLAIMTQLMGMKEEVYVLNNEILFVESEKKEYKNFRLGKNEIFANIQLRGSHFETNKWVKFCFDDWSHEILKRKPKFA